MSEQTQEVETKSNDDGNNDLASELQRLKSTNERLLAESQKNKTRMSEVEQMRQKLESYEQKKLEQEGNYQEMLEREREKRAQLEADLRARDNKLIKSNVFNYVSNLAKDAHDINDLLAQKDYASMIEIDEDTLEPVAESVQMMVEKLRNEKKYLFKGHKVAGMADTKPTMERPKEKTIKQMTDIERQELLKNSLGQIASR